MAKTATKTSRLVELARMSKGRWSSLRASEKSLQCVPARARMWPVERRVLEKGQEGKSTGPWRSYKICWRQVWTEGRNDESGRNQGEGAE